MLGILPNLERLLYIWKNKTIFVTFITITAVLI